MKPELLHILRCPATGQSLKLTVTNEVQGDIASGELVTPDGVKRYPIENYIPRFVSLDNYAQGFGFQWNKFRKTQLDSHTGIPLSRDCLFESSGWSPSMLKGKRVLDIGCGAGRFTEIALNAGAIVVALDYSSAVDACWANHGSCPNLNVIQGDIYHLLLIALTLCIVWVSFSIRLMSGRALWPCPINCVLVEELLWMCMRICG
jgi:uncharacterized protein YbaR (Trm112 family)